VRQLENICHWLTVMAPAQLVEVKDLPPEVMVSASVPEAMPSSASAPVAMAVPVAASHLPAMPGTAPAGAAVAAPLPFTSDIALAGDALAAPMVTSAEGGGPLAVADAVVDVGPSTWESGLEREAQTLLAAGRHDVWDALSRRFESRLILTALANTRGRRIEAAQKLGIGRNTITRKIQELGLE